MPTRPVPDGLAAALRAVHGVERAAVGKDQRRRAAQATSVLMLAAVDAGWQVTEIGRVIGMRRHAASRRVVAARDRRHPTGLAVPSPPPRRAPRPSDLLRVPVEQRDWLSTQEAADHAHVPIVALRTWRRGGLLPATRALNRTRNLYARADLQRVINAPRYNARGVNHQAVRAILHTLQGPPLSHRLRQNRSVIPSPPGPSGSLRTSTSSTAPSTTRSWLRLTPEHRPGRRSRAQRHHPRDVRPAHPGRLSQLFASPQGGTTSRTPLQ